MGSSLLCTPNEVQFALRETVMAFQGVPRDLELKFLRTLKYEWYSWQKPETGPPDVLPGDPSYFADPSHGGLVSHAIDDEGVAVWLGQLVNHWQRWPSQYERICQRIFEEIKSVVHGTPLDPLPPL